MARKRKPETSQKPIEQYDHKDKKRLNNPPVGLVDAHTDNNGSKKRIYQYDPHLDPQLQWAGKVKMVYFDPPYVIKYGSNFQPFVNKRDVKDGKDEDLTAEPEMIKEFSDTWKLGIHSYLTYLRDRLFLARELLHESGSVFVQISDEDVHHVRELMDEIFGVENFISLIQFKKTAYQETDLLANVCDFLIWYSKDIQKIKVRQLYKSRETEMVESGFTWLELENGQVTKAPQRLSEDPIGSKRFQSSNLTSQGYSEAGSQSFEFNGKNYEIDANRHWKTHRLCS